jgi:FkbM family methyltransferase
MQAIHKSQHSQALIEGVKQAGNSRKLAGPGRPARDLPKRLAFRLLRHIGVDVRRSRKHPTVIDFIENRGIEIIYDVGANVGQFGLALRRRGYKGRIISFEPVPSAFAVLQGIAARDGNWQVRPFAIGEARGEAWINVSANTQFSSLRGLSQNAASIDPESEIIGRELVQCWTLDSFESKAPALIKIDTQGFEREVC